MKNKNTNEELLKKLNDKYDKGLDNKADAEQSALININYINGKQYVRYNRQTKLIDEINFENSSEYREKGVFNRLRPLRNTILSKINTKIPVPQALPINQDDDDLDTAKATNAMLQDLYTRQKVEKKLKRSAKDMIDIGPAFLHIKWDPNAGTVMMDDVDSMLGDLSAMVTPEQKEKLRSKLDRDGKLRSGDVVIETIDMFEILVADPYEQDIQEQPWMMRVKAYDKEEAEKLFGKVFKETETAGRITSTNRSKYDNEVETLVDNLGVYNSERATDVVVVKEYFEKPCPEFPNGRYILFAGKHILKKENELPYINGEYNQRIYPFIKLGLDTPKLFYSHAFIEDMKEVQRRYNEVRNRKFEYITKNVHGQLAIQEGSLVDDEEITNKPGEIIWYKRGYTPPTIMKSNGPGTLDVDSELRSLEDEFIQVTGISTLSTTGTPNSSAVRGASMVQTLMESDDSKFSLIVDELINATIDIAKQAIRLYKQFMLPNEVRFTQFTKDLQTTVKWRKELLMEEIDIKNRVQLSRTDARRKEEVTMLLQSGLLNPDQSMLGANMTARLIEELDLGIPINEMPIKGYADVKKARRENKKIVNEMAEIDADDFDDHNVHYDIHTNYIKGDEYRRLVIVNPELDAVMRAHIQQHAEIVQAQMQKAQAEAIAQEKNKKGELMK